MTLAGCSFEDRKTRFHNKEVPAAKMIYNYDQSGKVYYFQHNEVECYVADGSYSGGLHCFK